MRRWHGPCAHAASGAETTAWCCGGLLGGEAEPALLSVLGEAEQPAPAFLAELECHGFVLKREAKL